jgi:hypothetical protein
MQSIYFAILATGLVVCAIGMFCITFLYRPAYGGRNMSNRAGSAKRRFGWPLYIGIVCVPLGIIIVFGAIIWRNHLPH